MRCRLSLRLAAAVVLFTTAGFGQDVPDELKSKVTIALQLVRSSKPAEAMSLFNEILAAKPDLFVVAVERGRLYQESNDHTKAISDFTSAIAASPTHADAYFRRCLSYYQTGSHSDAIVDCSKAIEINSNPFEYYYYRGLAHAATRAWEKAASDLSGANERNNNHPELHLQLGRIYFEMEHLVSSLREYTIAIQQRPGYPEAYRHRSIVKAVLGDPTGAKEDLAKAER